MKFNKNYTLHSHMISIIPSNKELQELHCANIPLIVEIPLFTCLEELHYSKCPLIDNIPHTPALKELHCYGLSINHKKIPLIELGYFIVQ